MVVLHVQQTKAGSVCLVHRGKFIWISGDVEKRENGWTVGEFCDVNPPCNE